MLTRNCTDKQDDSNFDVLALENQLQEDFKAKQLTEKFCQNYQENPKTTFIDGEYDGGGWRGCLAISNHRVDGYLDIFVE